MAAASPSSSSASSSARSPRARVFRTTDDVSGTLSSVLQARGWRSWDAVRDSENVFDLWWKLGRFNATMLSRLEAHQLVNHFRKTSGITCKDALLRNLRRMRQNHRKLYNFFPESFIVPREHARFVEAFRSGGGGRDHQEGDQEEVEEEGETKKKKEKDDSSDNVWICKPSVSSQGRNIFLITDPAQLEYGQSYVVQRYLGDPYLVGGYKFDMRIYVLVRSFRPLEAFIFQNGLARFGTEPYVKRDFDNLFAHLTNFSINKHGENADTEKDVIGTGSKWTLVKLFRFLAAQGIDTTLIWERTVDIVLLTLLSIAHDVPQDDQAFELFGYDVMLDADLKLWLIEVNSSPAIGISTVPDELVKRDMLNDLFDIVGLDDGFLSRKRVGPLGDEDEEDGYGDERHQQRVRALFHRPREPVPPPQDNTTEGRRNDEALEAMEARVRKQQRGKTAVAAAAVSKKNKKNARQQPPPPPPKKSRTAPNLAGGRFSSASSSTSSLRAAARRGARSPPASDLDDAVRTQRLGNYEQIFPFNRATRALNEQVVAEDRNSSSAFVKSAIQAVKRRRAHRLRKRRMAAATVQRREQK